jgi:orotidine-5'-phosphate decarboxylase
LSADCGLDGVVCSAQEISLVKTVCGVQFLTVTPGIRPAGSDVGDQKRIMTPPEAMQLGVDFIVIGRPITQASDAVKALQSINASIGFVAAE